MRLEALRRRSRSAGWARAGLLAGAVIAIDQLSKRAVSSSIAPGDTRNVLPGLQLTYTRNHGVAFGIAPGADAVVLAAVVLVADQVSKALVRGSIGRGERVDVLPGIDFVNARNTGVAFGFFAGGGTVVALVAAAALVALLAFFATHLTRPLVWLPTGLLIGGALSNILDRVRDGSVIDFIKLPLGWPPFNLADMAITVGVLTLLYVLEGPPSRGTDRRD